jgi:hypothetical protein
MGGVNVDALGAMLEEEARVADALAGVLRDERQAILALQADALLDCLARREALQEQLQALAQRRHAFLAGACGEPPPSWRCCRPPSPRAAAGSGGGTSAPARPAGGARRRAPEPGARERQPQTTAELLHGLKRSSGDALRRRRAAGASRAHRSLDRRA